MFTRSIAMRRNGHSRRKALKHRSLRGELLEPRAMLSAGPLLPFGSLLGASATPILTSASIAPSAGSTLSGVSEQLAAQGLDQSGHALSSSLRYAWSVSKLPSGAASPAFSVNSGSAGGGPDGDFQDGRNLRPDGGDQRLQRALGHKQHHDHGQARVHQRAPGGGDRRGHHGDQSTV